MPHRRRLDRAHLVGERNARREREPSVGVLHVEHDEVHAASCHLVEQSGEVLSHGDDAAHVNAAQYLVFRPTKTAPRRLGRYCVDHRWDGDTRTWLGFLTGAKLVVVANRAREIVGTVVVGELDVRVRYRVDALVFLYG